MRLVLARIGPIAGQLAMAMSAVGLVAFTPPAYGRMLLVPLDGQPVTETMVRDLQATPLMPGPMQGSWVVEGKRAPLAGLLLSKGIIVLAAPAAACVTPASSEDYSA